MNPTSNRGPVEIRIQNASSTDFDSVRVVFPDRHEEDYGAVAKGKLSTFRATGRAYRYAEIHVTAGGRDLSLQPIDYAGEQELAPGRYTYVLRTDSGRMSMDLQQAD